MSLRKALSLFTAVLAFAASAAWAQSPASPYTLLNPPQPSEGGKVEVIEFFWYGCPHCYTIDPAVAAWVKSAPKDVVFKRVPAYPSDAWGAMATMYYTLEAMGVIEQYHSRVFDAMHKQNVNLSNKGKREEWLKANGIDPAKYAEVEKSFTVNTKVARARQMTQGYKVDSVPRFIVNGKYVVSAESAGGNDRIFPAVDMAIAAARKEKS